MKENHMTTTIEKQLGLLDDILRLGVTSTRTITHVMTLRMSLLVDQEGEARPDPSDEQLPEIQPQPKREKKAAGGKYKRRADSPLNVKCPTCHAAVDKPCRIMTGANKGKVNPSYHVTRSEASGSKGRRVRSQDHRRSQPEPEPETTTPESTPVPSTPPPGFRPVQPLTEDVYEFHGQGVTSASA